MSGEEKYFIELKFPGDVDYIPAVRKFVAETLQAAGFTPKYAYRSEIVVDEICYNAITYGCQSLDAEVNLLFNVQGDRMELVVKDPGKGDARDRQKLKVAVDGKRAKRAATADPGKEKLGLEIVRMLSEELDFEIDNNNLTSVRVVRRREGAEVAK